MNFHLEFTPGPFAATINHQHKLLLIGSCFTENIGAKLKQYKFAVLENPNGILFNPISIAKSVNSYIPINDTPKLIFFIKMNAGTVGSIIAVFHILKKLPVTRYQSITAGCQ